MKNNATIQLLIPRQFSARAHSLVATMGTRPPLASTTTHTLFYVEIERAARRAL